MNLVLDRIEKSWISINWVVEYLLGSDTLPTYLKNCINSQKLEKIGLREHGYAAPGTCSTNNYDQYYK